MLKFAVVVAPLAIVATWGGNYLLDCFHTLEAPGVPFKFTYPSRAGDLTIEADSYSIAAGRGSIRIWKPKVLDQSGAVLAKLDSIEATGLNLLRGGDQVIRVKGRNLWGKLTRLKNGQIDLFDYLPQNTSGASATPYDVEVDRCQAEIVDLRGSKPWTKTVTSPKVKVVGIGSDWVATASGTISEVGSIDARIQNVTAEGLRISGSTQNLELTNVLAHLLDTPDAARLRQAAGATCKSLVVRGPFDIFVPKGKDPDVEASVDATALDVKYDRFSASRATFVGLINTRGISGSAEFVEGDSTASFHGAASWSGKTKVAGDLTASAPASEKLPAWATAFLPKGASFRNGAFHGWLSADSATSYHLSGEVEALSAVASNQRFDDVKVGVDVENEHVVLQVDRAVTASGPLAGVLTIDGKQKQIQGYVAGQNLDLQDLGTQLGYKQVIGQASISALITGTFTHPSLQFETHGQGVITPIRNHTFSLGNFEAAGSFSSDVVQVDQAYFNTAYGLIYAHGSLGDTGSLGLDVTGRGMKFAEYDPRLSGAANLRARITGTLKNPHAVGRIEASDLAYKANSIQAVVANFLVDPTHAEISSLEATRGTASLSAQGAVQFKSGKLSGALSVNDLQIADWLGDEFVGAIDVPKMELSGTISHPIALGTIDGASLVTKGVELDKLTAGVTLDGDQLAVSDILVAGAGGQLKGSAVYDISKRSGQAALDATGLDLSRLSLDRFQPDKNRPVEVGGRISASATVLVASGNLVDVTAVGHLDGLAVNGADLGTGSWQAGWTNRILTGSLDIGGKDKSIKLTNAVYDLDSQRLACAVAISNYRVEDVISRALPYFPGISFDLKDSLNELHGPFNLGCTFEGTPSDPAVTVSSLNIPGLQYGQQKVGDIAAKFDLKGRKWNIDSATISGGPALVAVKGTIDEQGDMHLDASKENLFDLSKLATFDPRLSRLTGTGHLWVSADGPTECPRIVASLNVENLFAPPGVALTAEPDDRYLRFTFDNVTIDPNNKEAPGLKVAGSYFYKGFTGTISGSAPFEYPFQIPVDKPVTGAVSFDKSNLKDIAALVEGFDPLRTDGTVVGSIAVNGTYTALALSGNFDLAATSIGFTATTQTLDHIQAGLKLEKGALNLVASGQSGKGTIEVLASIPVEDVAHLSDVVQKAGPIGLLDRPIKGFIKATDVALRQKIYDQSNLAGFVSSNIAIEGTLQKPMFKGDVTVASGDVVFNGLPPSAPPSETPLIDPRFDINLKVNETARLRSATADLSLSGGGTLSGSLHNPKVEALVTVEKGTVRLPASVLRIQQGGTVKINYGIQSRSAASIVVDLEGDTSVTASRFGDLDVQRYDITLLMKGDLLQDNGLTLDPSSDPPDLSPDRILGILGETDALQSLTAAGKSDTVVQAALLSAVPSFLDPYTRQLAEGLGLDFFNIEYNAFDQASITIGKVLGSGFSVEGNRQISDPPPGFPFRYDLRLIYHPRRLPGLLNQFRFYFGADEVNRWKLGVEYAIRF